MSAWYGEMTLKMPHSGVFEYYCLALEGVRVLIKTHTCNPVWVVRDKSFGGSESHLCTGHIAVVQIEIVIADCAPLTIVKYLKSTFTRRSPANQPQVVVT